MNDSGSTAKTPCVLLVSAHPEPASFTMSLTNAVKQALDSRGVNVAHRDLCGDWEPRMARGELASPTPPQDTLGEQQSVLNSQVLAFVFPVWWWSPPAALQGWLERVMSVGFAFKYDVSAGGFVGRLSGDEAARRTCVIITSSGSDPKDYPIEWQRGSHLNFVSDIMQICGIEVRQKFNFHGISEYAPKEVLAEHLAAVRDYFSKMEIPSLTS